MMTGITQRAHCPRVSNTPLSKYELEECPTLEMAVPPRLSSGPHSSPLRSSPIPVWFATHEPASANVIAR